MNIYQVRIYKDLSTDWKTSTVVFFNNKGDAQNYCKLMESINKYFVTEIVTQILLSNEDLQRIIELHN